MLGGGTEGGGERGLSGLHVNVEPEARLSLTTEITT